MQEHLEATNHYEAIHYIRDLMQESVSVSERVIKDIHAIVLRGIDRDNAGKYRTIPVAISGSRHLPSQPWLVPELMENMVSWISQKGEGLHPVILAAELHERLVTIHPFVDGNGRTARLLMNLVLLQNGYTIANIPGDPENRLAYYNALEKCNLQEDKDDFIFLIASYTYDSMKRLIQQLGGDS